MRVGGPAGRIGTALIALVVLAGLAVGGAWYATGGRWQVVATPSMGTAAPVGTLVLTRPATSVQPGDVVTYRPPVANHPLTVTHRVVAVGGPDEHADRTFRTRGDINGADDPWTVRTTDLVGKASFVGPGLGWLVKALPLLVSGALLLWWVTRLWVPRRWGLPLRVLGFSGLIAAATTVLKPFVGVVTLATTTDAAGTHVTLVSTGLLPIRATAATGGFLDLVDGQVGVLTTQVPQGEKGTVITSGVHMPIWLWVVMVAFWLTPMLYGLVSAWRRPLLDEPTTFDDPPTTPLLLPVTAPIERYRAPLVGSSMVAGLVVALTLVTASTTASFTAQVTNSANTAASAPFFTCTAALTDGASDFLVWPLDDATVTTGATARDASVNARTGVYTGGFTTTADKPCPRDTPARAVTLAPTAAVPSYVTPSAPGATPSRNTFSLAIWFRTTTTTGGRLFGSSTARTGASFGSTDRHLYMTDAGRIVFGVQPTLSPAVTVTSTKAYNDGVWHMAVATLSTAGMTLSVDGAQVAANPGVTTGSLQLLGAYWRVGWDTLAGWPSRPATDYWTGSLADAAVYTEALSPTRIAALYTAGT